jgi:hypothetical protein
MQVSEKTVADASSTPTPGRDRIPQYHPFTSPRCHFCGRKGVIVDHFPRRGYGKRSSGGNLKLF